MYTDDLHEVTFIWPRTDAQIVVLTGSFDNWSKTFCLAKGPNGFYGTIRVPWNTTVAYKYIVDGKWSVDNAKPKRFEPEGYVNNVYAAPLKPFEPTEPIYQTSPIQLHLNGVPMNGTNKVEQNDEISTVLPAGATTEKTSKPEINGHVDMGESRQGVPPQGAKEAEGAHTGHGVVPVLVDGRQAEGNGAGAATAGQEVAAGEKAADEKEGHSHPSPQPTQQPAEATIPEQQQPEKSKVDQGVSQSAANGYDDASKKPPLIGPFDPVNAHETPVIDGGAQGNSSGTAGDEISTHKPLGPVPKQPRLPSEAAEGKAAGDKQASKGSTEDGVPAPHTGANGESSAGAHPHPHAVAEGKPPAGHCVEKETKTAVEPPQSESHVSKEAAQTPANQPDQKPSPFSTPAEETAPTGGTKESVPPGPVPAPLGAKPAEKSPSAPASPTKPRFPRFSRDSSSSEPPHFGAPRRRKSTIIEKIKHIFSHEKQKGEKHKK